MINVIKHDFARGLQTQNCSTKVWCSPHVRYTWCWLVVYQSLKKIVHALYKKAEVYVFSCFAHITFLGSNAMSTKHRPGCRHRYAYMERCECWPVILWLCPSSTLWFFDTIDYVCMQCACRADIILDATQAEYNSYNCKSMTPKTYIFQTWY